MNHFADYYMHDMSMPMGTLQQMRPARYPMAASNKTWSGRVEKSRSQQNSPATDYRRRGYPMTRTPSQYNSSHSQFHPQRRISRPYSWGPIAANSMSLPTTGYVISPATSSNHSTPMYNVHASTPGQYPTVQTTSIQKVYNNVAQYQRQPNRASSVGSASSCYSSQSTSPASPLWHQQRTDTIAPSLTSASSKYDSPELSSSWQYPNQQQTQPHTTSYSPCTPFTSTTTHQSQSQTQPSTDIPFAYSYDYLLDRPPSPDLLWSGKKADDDGEVLVALGLYDAPDAFDSPTTAPRKLKLAETWQLPTKSSNSASSSTTDDDNESLQGVSQDSEEDEEVLDEEISFPKVPAGTSWFLP